MKSDLCDRSKAFALQVVQFAGSLPNNPFGRLVRDQVLRSSTSVAANYRASRRARSTAEFVAKLGVVEEECDETLFWIEMAAEGGLVSGERIMSLSCEGEEILKITVASIRSSRDRATAKRVATVPASGFRLPT